MFFANTDWYLYNFRRSLISFLKSSGHEVLLLSPPGVYGPKLLELGFAWQAVPMDRHTLNPFRELFLIGWLVQLMRREKIDLVHNFTIKCVVYGSIAARLAGVFARVNAVAGMGYVFTNRNLRARFLRPIVSELMRLAFRGAGVRLILQNSDDALLFERAQLLDQASVRLIRGSGVDCVTFAPEALRSSVSRGQRFRVVLPARILWEKGIAEYVAAARKLRAQGRLIDFLLAGDRDSENPAAVPEAMVRAWEAEGLIQWLGHVEDMPALFRSVDAVILPSFREGLPKGLIEAGASGLPLVATDVPGCREVVMHEKTGFLVPVRDAEALALAIARLQDFPEFSARMGAAAREKVLAEFDEKIVIKQTEAVYRELCDGLICRDTLIGG